MWEDPVGNDRLRGVVQERLRLLREGLALRLASEDDLEVTAAVATGAELLDPWFPGVDFVVFEADVGDWDAIEIARELRRRDPGVRLVATGGDSVGGRALAADTFVEPCTVLARSAGVSEVLAAVRGGHDATRRVATGRSTAVSDPRAVLTTRQLEILVQIGMGLAAHEIAARLQISPKTVDNHKQRIYARLGVQSQAHAIAVAVRAGLIPVGGESGGFAS